MGRRSRLLPLVLAPLLGSSDGDESRRLRIRNGCSSHPIWIAVESGGATSPPEQNVRIEPDGHYDFLTDGVSPGSRFWPKMWCDEDGSNCALGGSGGPGQSCVGAGSDYSRCAPPIDTKFEATFGVAGQICEPSSNALDGCDHLDVSLVDGYTLPFKLEARGKCLDDAFQVVDDRVLDCSAISIDKCPRSERILDQDVDLVATNPETEQAVGCYSPCMRLIDDKWGNDLATGRSATDKDVAPYCCPTPPESPAACKSGPMPRSSFVSAVHSTCPGVYGFAYDDKMGLVRCDASTQYEVTFFCPNPMPASPAGEGAASEATPATTLTTSAAPPAPAPFTRPPEAFTGRPVPSSLLGNTGCRAICHTDDGRASCGFRMQYAATTRYRGQARACDLANILVLLDCADVCQSCQVVKSGCSQAVAAGIASNVGSPYWVAEQEAMLERSRAGVGGGGLEFAASTAPPAAGAAGATGGLSGALAELQGSMPQVVAGFSVVVILVACTAQYAAKLLGWSLPATRAAEAAALAGGATMRGPGLGSYGNAAHQYEGLAQDGTMHAVGRAPVVYNPRTESGSFSPSSQVGTSCYG